MQLDSITLLIATSVAVAVVSLSLAYFWYRDRRSTWLLWWSVPLLVAAAGGTWFTRPDWETNVVGIVIGNGLRILAIAMLWQGARVFEGRQPLWLGLFAGPVAWFLLCMVPGTVESLPARVMAVSLASAALCALAAWEFWRGRAEKLPSRWPIIGVTLSFAAVMLARVVGVDAMPFPVGALPPEPNWVGGFTLVVFVHCSFAALLLIALTKERHELGHRRMSLVDPLTGLMNRRALVESAARKDPGADRSPVAVLALDLDRFKSVNDRYGHRVGDDLLAAFARIAAANVRPADELYRLGGEEFCFLLPNTDAEAALAVAERVREAFEQHRSAHDDTHVGATVSIGVAVAETPGVPIDVMLAAADAALYEAKSQGRNRTVLAEPRVLAEVVRISRSGNRPVVWRTGS